LAKELGHADDAVASWNRALTLDPSQVRAHLYLADELGAEGKPSAAVPHYLMYLEKITKGEKQERPPAAELIAVVLRMAQCQVQSHTPKQAAASYEVAQKIASQTGEAKLESFASVAGAEVAAGQGDKARALRLYQHALLLDQT